ncbi:hypothetical protein EV13_2403 [Prochlorococcus sp. MIT 0702]|nr:hypothetical protein EV13_2403 [Prochlorococcus sp. MIT 0702]KGG29398.1 hypothetical protein EV12_0180 [Prochlorococcus sp. MIT 0701]KGG33699.1 hypothetical protein EV14_1588 [Prochlorococcus sp. MIT 0703]
MMVQQLDFPLGEARNLRRCFAGFDFSSLKRASCFISC